MGSDSAYTAISLEAWTFQLRWPDGIVRDTDLWLDPGESGKPRLRSLRPQAFQIGRMLASMLMLPDPRRNFNGTFSGLPVARHKGYVLTRLGFGPDTEFTGINDVVTIDPVFVDIDNQNEKVTIGIRNRWARIEAVYEHLDALPTNVRSLVVEHRAFMASGDPVDTHLSSIVRKLQGALIGAASGWQPDTDPLLGLEAILGIVPSPGPSLPPPDEIGEDEPTVSARSAHEYRLAKIRGVSGRRFSTDIRAAYGNRCAFCGAVYGGVASVRSGVDAAHILAWSKYDLDVVPNGISLCKLHHWAFDAALLVPVYEGSACTLKFTELAIANFAAATLAKIGQHKFVVPEEWLPEEPALWPSKKYLDVLYADLAIEFAA
ncbi:HNH endonuclease [Microbacterium amylolyticum]|uniref:HNH nuclease domain-containing protein n=1 Tax=Microbacterium amylolyticum TaxID=936337 RepID=A0ABS4ZF42_9MICO|nr:HNH endonuclease [Microbacterium amylolyticum]MBP2435899.1 hypothetical protein [Microbacterium amylolyticum]